jgi:hypothetical protein
MRTRRLAAAAALALTSAALVAAPAQADPYPFPICVYSIQHKPTPPRDLITWNVTNPGTWVLTGQVFVHLTDLNVDRRYARKLDPTTLTVTLNLTRMTGGHPYTFMFAQVTGHHDPDDGERLATGCNTA